VIESAVLGGQEQGEEQAAVLLDIAVQEVIPGQAGQFELEIQRHTRLGEGFAQVLQLASLTKWSAPDGGIRRCTPR